MKTDIHNKDFMKLRHKSIRKWPIVMKPLLLGIRSKNFPFFTHHSSFVLNALQEKEKVGVLARYQVSPSSRLAQ